jgi:[acyl-carrier-protein] S-malonyltransferase
MSPRFKVNYSLERRYGMTAGPVAHRRHRVDVTGEDPPGAGDGRAQLLPLSAGSRAELVALAGAYRDLARSGTAAAADLSDLCYTAAVARAHQRHRLAFIAASHAELATAIDETLAADGAQDAAAPSGDATGTGLVFVFPGQGAQWLGMGRELLAGEPAFREAFRRCDRMAGRYLDCSLEEQLLLDASRSRLSDIGILQPTMVSLQIALADLWRSWGVSPDAVVGNSMGEIAAAHVSGALRLDDAMMIACRRSALLRRVSGRGVLAMVELSASEAERLIAPTGGRISVAGANSPSATVLAGDRESIEQLSAELGQRDVYCKIIRDTVASHSRYVDELREDLVRALADLRPARTVVPQYSTVTVAPLTGTELGPEYWNRNLREPVRFADTIRLLHGHGYRTFLEVSPHPVLTTSVRQTLQHTGLAATTLISCRRGAERASLLGSLAALYTGGHAVHWRGLYPSGGRLVALPGDRPPPRRRLTPYQEALLGALTAR